jgi:hypothetical protein
VAAPGADHARRVVGYHRKPESRLSSSARWHRQGWRYSVVRARRPGG